MKSIDINQTGYPPFPASVVSTASLTIIRKADKVSQQNVITDAADTMAFRETTSPHLSIAVTSTFSHVICTELPLVVDYAIEESTTFRVTDTTGAVVYKLSRFAGDAKGAEGFTLPPGKYSFTGAPLLPSAGSISPTALAPTPHVKPSAPLPGVTHLLANDIISNQSGPVMVPSIDGTIQINRPHLPVISVNPNAGFTETVNSDVPFLLDGLTTEGVMFTITNQLGTIVYRKTRYAGDSHFGLGLTLPYGVYIMKGVTAL